MHPAKYSFIRHEVTLAKVFFQTTRNMKSEKYPVPTDADSARRFVAF